MAARASASRAAPPPSAPDPQPCRDARSPPSVRLPTPWLSRSARAPPLSPLLFDATSVHCIMHVYAHICANRAQRAPSFVLRDVGTWPTLRGKRTSAGTRIWVLGVCMMVGMDAPL